MKLVGTSSIAILLIYSVSVIAQIQKTPDGFEYEIIKDVAGELPEIGDLVTLDMVISTSDKHEIKNSYKDGKPILFPVKVPQFIGDIYTGVALLSVGDSARFWVDTDSMYLKIFQRTMPEFVKPGSELEVTVKVHKIRSQKEYVNEQKGYYNQNLKESDDVIEARKKKEEAEITDYIHKSGLKYSRTKNGVYYTILDAGQDSVKFPQIGDAVVFHYIGQFLNGQQFESSWDDIGRSVSFTLGDNAVIPGWDEVFPFIPMGGAARVIIPSRLAYGNINKGKIPANSVLIFDINLMAIY